MATPLTTKRESLPSVKLQEPGANVVVALVDVAEIPWKDFKTKQVKVGNDGRPRTQDVVTGLLISADRASTPDGEALEPGELVSIFLPGHKRWQWIEAQRALDGGVVVGDVLRWKFTHEEEPSEKGNHPKKVHICELRHARAEEQEQSKRCEELHAERKRSDATPLGDGYSGNSGADEEEPF